MRLAALITLGLLLAPAAWAAERSTDAVNWKLFFNQLFALELRKENLAQGGGDATYQATLDRYTAYTDKHFSDTIADVVKADTSAEAYQRRQAIYANPHNYQLISTPDFSQSVPPAVRALPAVDSYLHGIEANRQRPIRDGENFFTTAEARNLMAALSYSGGRLGGQRVALLLVPGYAAHAIKFGIFPEIVADMNRAWGRDAARPILDDGNGIDFKYENYVEFYGKSHGGPGAFDILTPAGWEMGNTVGLNAETADLLAQWIANLPPAFANYKFMLLGYSKGAPIILEMLKRHPDLKARVLGVVTYAGVVQGTHVGRSGGEQIREYLGKRTIAEMIDTIKAKGTKASLDALAPFAASFDLGITKIPVIKDLMEIGGIDSSLVETQINRLLQGREIRELLDGIDDLSPLVRSTWNILNFDNDLVNPGTFMFNLAAVTDISSFAGRTAASSQRLRNGALITPRLTDAGAIDWQHFSLDAWFLYLSSLSGFKLAPGGLYDTQVDLQHTKTPWLDKSPFSASLTTDELTKLWGQANVRAKLQANGIATLAQFASTPRDKLLRPDAWRNIRAYDLGEFKGHHWSLFHQAFRAPPEVAKDYYIWEFPRHAFMRALLQTMALYNVINQNS